MGLLPFIQLVSRSTPPNNDVLNETTDDPSVMYKLYKSELDTITPEQVNQHCISDYHASIVTRYQFCILSHFAGGMGAVWKRRVLVTL